MANSFALLPTAVRIRFIAWSALVLGLLVVFLLRVLPTVRFETDILALLPKTQADAAMDAALDAFSSEIARTQLFLIGAASSDDAKNAAHAFAEKLTASKAFAKVNLEINADVEQRFRIYLEHRGYLLARDDLKALEANHAEAIEQQALRAAFTPAGLVRFIGLSDDPLGLLSRFLQEQSFSFGNAQLDGSVATVQRDGQTYVLVTAETQGSPFAQSVQDVAMPALADAQAAARSVSKNEIQILSSGALQHAAAATTRATTEISVFGTIETIGVIILLWSVLGAARPIILASITLGVATVAALTVTHFVFGTVHIFALVFGSSLIGGVIDYSIHFFADRFRDPAHWKPVDAVHHVGGAIVLGLMTTLVGYVVLALVPFPGLTQIAVFCAVGLAAGCACVLCWYPFFAQPGRKLPPTRGATLGAAIDRFMGEWRWSRTKIIAMVAIGVVLLTGIARLNIQDDVRALQSSPPELVHQEQAVRDLLGSGVETRFFLVTGSSEQSVLATERQLSRALDSLIAGGALRSYQSISTAVPPLSDQQQAHRLLAEQVYANDQLFDRVMRKLGFPSEAIEKRRREFIDKNEPLTLATWLQSPAAEAMRPLWLGKIGQREASIVTLGGIRDVDALSAIRIDGVRLIDRVASTSEILSQYRRVMSGLLLLIYAVAGIVLAVRFGWRDAPRMLLPSLLATLITLGFFGWLGVPLNLFVLLGFWLVLGMGIDYGIFLRHGQETRDARSRATAILSVTLSACTTLLAFGPLAFSATPFIHSIGLTLLCAIMLSWLLVMFSCLTDKQSR